MRVLITWGTKEGGTEGIARILGETLERAGHEVSLVQASKAQHVSSFDAVIVGGSVYAFRWHRDCVRFVERNVEALRRMPVWFFSSGPLDESAEKRELPPMREVAVLMQRVGAIGHMTFGGRISSDAHSRMAREMAKKNAGDWRNPTRIREWGDALAAALPSARPGIASEPEGLSWWRLVRYAMTGAGVTAAALLLLLLVLPRGVAFLLGGIASAAAFVGMSFAYFRLPGARRPVLTGSVCALMTALFALSVGPASIGAWQMLVGSWFAVLVAFLATAITGSVLGMIQGARSSGLMPPPEGRTGTVAVT